MHVVAVVCIFYILFFFVVSFHLLYSSLKCVKNEKMKEKVSSAIEMNILTFALAIEAVSLVVDSSSSSSLSLPLSSTTIIGLILPFLMFFPLNLRHLYCFVLVVASVIYYLAFELYSHPLMHYYHFHCYCHIDNWLSHVFVWASSYFFDCLYYSYCLMHDEYLEYPHGYCCYCKILYIN